MHQGRLIIFFSCLMIFTVSAQDTEKVIIDEFKEAEPVEKVMPRYPRNPLMRAQEGWVILNFMVDEEGKVFEPMVVDSMGAPEFERAALEVAKRFKYKPATFADKPVSSSLTNRITFLLEETPYARGSFAYLYRKLLGYLEDDDKENAVNVMEEMETEGAVRLYEDAFLNLARYNYDLKYGDSDSQLEHLSKALFYRDNDTYETYLPEETAHQLWPHLFVLETKNNLFTEALKTYEIMTKIGLEEAVQTFGPAVEQINALKTDDSAYRITAETNTNGSWAIGLFKDEFYIEKSQGRINEMKLRCDKKYVFFKYEEGIQYNVPDSYGHCSLEILGEANMTFELVQQ